MKVQVFQVLLSATFSSSTAAFAFSTCRADPTKSQASACDSGEGVDRRAFLSSGVAAATAATLATFVPNQLPAYADVSDGNVLPPGAKEFSRVLKVKTDFANIGKRVAESPDEIDSKEWEKISQYLRTVYAAGEDMKVIAKGMYDPEKKKRAGELIKIVQKAAQAGEIPVSQKNAKGFIVIQEKVSNQLEEFFDLLVDVPDEL